MLPYKIVRTIFRRVRLVTVCLPVVFFILPFSIGGELPEQIQSYSLAAKPTEQIVLRYLATYPHDSTAFTQGLLWDGGYLYESAGQYGLSTLRRIEPKSGKVTAYVNLPPRYFAEGLALIDRSLFQLTWRENRCFVYDKATLQKKGEFQYPGEGWGLTYDGESLILSDGTSTLRFFDPKTFKQKRKIEVVDAPRNQRSIPIRHLNELEWIRGEIWANVWQTTKIVRIEPKKGTVLGWLEMEAFVPPEHRNDTQNCVLNGIAFDPEADHVYITGKYWNVMHQFQLPK